MLQMYGVFYLQPNYLPIIFYLFKKYILMVLEVVFWL